MKITIITSAALVSLILSNSTFASIVPSSISRTISSNISGASSSSNTLDDFNVTIDSSSQSSSVGPDGISASTFAQNGMSRFSYSFTVSSSDSYNYSFLINTKNTSGDPFSTPSGGYDLEVFVNGFNSAKYYNESYPAPSGANFSGSGTLNLYAGDSVSIWISADSDQSYYSSAISYNLTASSAVPIPSSLSLFLSGIFGLFLRHGRKR